MRRSAGGSAWPAGVRTTRRSTTTRPGCPCAITWDRCSSAATCTPTTSPGGRRGCVGIGWRSPPWRWRCWTRWLREQGVSLRPSSAPFEIASSVACRSASCRPSPSCSTQVAGYVAEGYRRIKLKIEPAGTSSPSRAVREPSPDVPLSVDANAAYTLDQVHLCARWTTSSCSDRATLGRRRPGGAREAAAAIRDADLPGRVDPLGRRRRRSARARRRVASSTSSRGGSAAFSRPAASTISCSPRAFPSGAAACWRRASGAPPTSRWPRCPGSRCPATPRPRHRYFATDVTEPFVLARRHDGTCPPARDRCRADRRAPRGDHHPGRRT